MPGALNVRLTVHAEVEGDAGIVYEPSSKFTLCSPPWFCHVTVSPWLMTTLLGLNVSEGVAFTVWLAAHAPGAAASAPRKTPIRRQRLTARRLTAGGRSANGLWSYDLARSGA